MMEPVGCKMYVSFERGALYFNNRAIKALCFGFEDVKVFMIEHGVGNILNFRIELRGFTGIMLPLF